MRYYSDELHKFFDDAESCAKAEAEHKKAFEEKEEKKKKLKEQRKARAAEVDEAYKAVKTAEKKYYELRNTFVRDYGSYHVTYSDTNAQPFTSLFDLFFN